MDQPKNPHDARKEAPNIIPDPSNGPSDLKGAKMFPIILVFIIAGTLLLCGSVTYLVHTIYRRHITRASAAPHSPQQAQHNIELSDLSALRNRANRPKTPEQGLLSSEKPLPTATPDSHGASSQWSDAESTVEPYSRSPGQGTRHQGNSEPHECRSIGQRTMGDNDDDDAWTDVEIREGSAANLTFQSVPAFEFEFVEENHRSGKSRAGPNALSRPK